MVIIYLDKLYCNTTHSDTRLWYIFTGNIIRNKSTSIGRILIFIHDITKDGPRCNFDIIKGRPTYKIKWKVDTPQVNSTDIKTTNKAAAPLHMTSKLILLSDFHTGEYHYKMKGNMFMKWITTKVIPLFASNYPGMQMVPVIDNAPYHRVRGIPSLTIFSKNINVDLMKEHGIDYVLLPMTNDQISILPK